MQILRLAVNDRRRVIVDPGEAWDEIRALLINAHTDAISPIDIPIEPVEAVGYAHDLAAVTIEPSAHGARVGETWRLEVTCQSGEERWTTTAAILLVAVGSAPA